MAKLDKLDIADEMLDAAIEEYLNKKRCSAALNLAAVAQELYGKAVRIDNGTDTMTKIANKSFTLYKESNSYDATLKEFKETAFHVKNAIKHLENASDRYLEFNPFKEARLMIAVALHDKAQLNRASSSWDDKFKEFVSIYIWYHSGQSEE